MEIHSQFQVREEEEDEEEDDPRGIPPLAPRFSLKLLSPMGWQILDSFLLDPGERVLCGCVNTLRHVATKPGIKLSYRSHIAIGTGTQHAEERAAKGRILLFEVDKMAIDSTHENGQLVLFWEKSQRGATTAMADLEGHLVVNTGPKIFVYKWDEADEDLTPCGFHDSQVYAVTIRTLKNFILIGDIHKSIHLYIWMDRSPRTLKLLGSDFSRLEVFAVEFAGIHNEVGFTVTDSEGNLRVFQYSQKIAEVDQVEQMIPVAAINVGARITNLLRMQMLPFQDEDGTGHRTLRLCNVYATTRGEIGFFIPLDLRAYKRFFMLQMRLVTALPHHAGLHPAAYRIPTHHNTKFPNVKNIIDGDLISRYVGLDHLLQEELAKSIATSSRRIMENLFDYNTGTSFF